MKLKQLDRRMTTNASQLLFLRRGKRNKVIDTRSVQSNRTGGTVIAVQHQYLLSKTSKTHAILN